MSWFGAKPGEELSMNGEASFEVFVPAEMREAMTVGGTIASRISRREALQVPAVLRSRNLICSTLSRLPVHIYNQKREQLTGSEAPTTLLDQIDPDIPNVVTIAETYDDLFFEGVSWWVVTARNFQGYPTSAQHISPDRVHITNFSPPVNGNYPPLNGQPIGRIYVDGYPVGDENVIRFDSPNPAFLVHAARAVRSCLALDQTANTYASEPVPMGYFTPKEGARDPSDEKVVGILDRWAASRRQRVWGYVNSALELKQLQFNAEQIQLSDQRQHAVLEIARAAGVDPEDLGVSTTSRTYQNAEQRRLDLLDFTLAAYSSAFEERLSMGDVTPRGYYVKTSYDGFLRSDTKTRMETYKIAREIEALTHDEMRELEDRPETPEPKPAVTPQLVPVPDGQEENGALARREAR